MSWIQLQEIVAENREDLESAGVRGIDLDYILEPIVDHRACLANLEKLIEGPLVRWRQILMESTADQLDYLKLVEPSHPKVLAAKAAKKDIKNFFKGHVLCFHKDAERRLSDERKMAKPSKNDWPLEGIENEQQ